MEGLHEKRKGMETSSQGDEEYQHFLEDLEEDPELRQHVNIFKDKRKMDQLVRFWTVFLHEYQMPEKQHHLKLGLLVSSIQMIIIAS